MFKITPKRVLKIKTTLRSWKLLWLDLLFVFMRWFIGLYTVTKATIRNLRMVWNRRDIYKFFPYQTQRAYKSIRHHKDWKRRGVNKIAKAMQVTKSRKHSKNKKRKQRSRV